MAMGHATRPSLAGSPTTIRERPGGCMNSFDWVPIDAAATLQTITGDGSPAARDADLEPIGDPHLSNRVAEDWKLVAAVQRRLGQTRRLREIRQGGGPLAIKMFQNGESPVERTNDFQHAGIVSHSEMEVYHRSLV